LDLRSLLKSVDLSVDSIDSGLERYTATWWRLDQAYRLCIANLRAYNQSGLTKGIRAWVENHYVNSFLLPLADHWSERLAQLTQWQATALPRQREFHMRYVQPTIAQGKRLFVVVSDALRYEAAREFAERIHASKGWSAETEALFGALPTYTQLGMAALLPGARITVDPVDATVAIDGQSASGTVNRDKILKAATGGRAKALKFQEFRDLNTKVEGRDLVRDHDLIVIYHNQIDKVGDERESEAKTFESVEQAFVELELIVRKIANLKGSHIVITADHGFLFQQEAIDSADKAIYPPADVLTYKNRRFAYGENIDAAQGVKVFTAQALGLSGTWSAVFPLSLGRFPKSGSGSRFVHGGPTLQEIVVPVIRLKRERKDEIRQVEVQLLGLPARITTARLKLRLFQSEAVEPKVQERTLRISLVAKADGALLCEPRTLRFDSTATEPREREQLLELVLSNAADDYNNKELELRLEEVREGASQALPYKNEVLKLQRAFGNDFDDF
jgi:uncharacterized protein (TIGR02687 family)